MKNIAAKTSDTRLFIHTAMFEFFTTAARARFIPWIF
jgi:hypothetical protein